MAETASGLASDEFTLDELHLKWRQFAFIAQEKGQNTVFHSLTADIPKLSENLLVSYTVTNKTQFRFIETVEGELLAHLKKELNNYKIKLKIEIEETEVEETVVLSEMDKLQEMMKENPSLKELQRKFNLSFE